ncbi:hypothetical protein HC175_11460 [Salinimicrobium sp. CDJ15-91]|uniref:Phage protein n=1 Tax=Salinimicrobium oceani TaxID=2722702 RepID=A0ABX1CZ42_9FLAO|nr:hypothetical protein [Salinimicrobium oceani]
MNRIHHQTIQQRKKTKDEKKELKRLGLKEFYFGKNKSTMIMAVNYKEAAALYQTNRKKNNR